MNDGELVIGISGGVAAYKSAILVSQLIQSGARVTVVMTPAAQQFIGSATFQALTGRAVIDDVFDIHSVHISNLLNGQHCFVSHRPLPTSWPRPPMDWLTTY